MDTEDLACQICGQARLREVGDFATLPRITSDCRPYPAGGSLHVCLACGGVQKVPDAQWLREIAGIYADYAAYYQSGGDEQIVLDPATATLRRRSDVILDNLAPHTGPTGHALDVGCGNGATLSAMSARLSGWSFSGYELGDGSQARLDGIPRFSKLHTGPLDAIRQRFDLVTMIHSLEHFVSPAGVLADLSPIVGGGKLFIEVSNNEENPFDILVADHLMHFSPTTLARLVRRTGYTPISIATRWVSKEISLLARVGPSTDQDLGAGHNDGSAAYQRICGYVDWLRGLRRAALRSARGDRPFGIFGTSIAATWLEPQLSGRVLFFVDEDTSRIGREHLGRPIVSPTEIPGNAVVFLPLAPRIAAAISDRLAKLSCTVVLPPNLPSGSQ